jgi:DNA polymerase-4
LLGVGVAGLTDTLQDHLFDLDESETTRDAAEAAGGAEVTDTADSLEEPGTVAELTARHARRWSPGVDVEHTEHGRGWVWGAGLGRVTVRFETWRTGPGPVRTFADDDPDLRRAEPLAYRPDDTESPAAAATNPRNSP